jgi:hypothetical protein
MTRLMIPASTNSAKAQWVSLCVEGGVGPSEQAVDVVGSTRGLEIFEGSFLQLAR